MERENNITIKDIQSTRFVWDKMSNVTTAMAVIGTLGISIFMILQINTQGYHMLIGVAILVVTMAALATFTPLGLTVDDEYIVINKLVGKVIIKKSDITSIQSVEGKVIRRSGRLAGSNGGFGYWGKYRHRSIGSYTLYATNLNKLVLIETDKKKYIINY
jgi:hypothetical protein